MRPEAEIIAKAIAGIDCGDQELKLIAEAITESFRSDNDVVQRNGERANIVEAVGEVADGLRQIAHELQGLDSTLGRIGGL